MTLVGSRSQDVQNGPPSSWQRLVFHLLLVSATAFIVFFANDLTVQDWGAMTYPFLLVLCGLAPLALQIYRVAPKQKSKVLKWLSLSVCVAIVGAASFAGKLVVVYQATVAISLPFGLGFAVLAALVAWREKTKRVRFYSSRTHFFRAFPQSALSSG